MILLYFIVNLLKCYRTSKMIFHYNKRRQNVYTVREALQLAYRACGIDKPLNIGSGRRALGVAKNCTVRHLSANQAIHSHSHLICIHTRTYT